MTTEPVVAKPRDRGERDVVVLGTSDARTACKAAGVWPETHRWGGTFFYETGWVLHRDGTASLQGQGKRPAVLFAGVRTREEADR